MKYEIKQGDALEVLCTMPDESVNCCVTSPPYWGLRDYGVPGQIGIENTLEDYIQKMVEVFWDVKRILKKDGTLWLNLGDTYFGSGCGTNDYRTEASRSLNKSDEAYNKYPPQKKTKHQFLKSKDLCGIPWRVAFALQSDGWYLRSDIIWHKPNPMPESVTDRPTKAHEYIFLLAKSSKYHYDSRAIMEPLAQKEKYNSQLLNFSNDRKNKYGEGRNAINPKTLEKHRLKALEEGRNKRSVWTIATHPYPEAHFATFPESLVRPCILAGCPEGGGVLDPFCGAGTTGLVALKLMRNFIGIELNPSYVTMATKRIEGEMGLFV